MQEHWLAESQLSVLNDISVDHLITCSDGSLSTVVRSMTSSDGQTHFSMSGHTGTPDRIAIKNGRGDYVTHMTP